MAAVGPGFPGGATTYVPSFKDSGNLIIGFSRNVQKFPLPRYIQIVKTPREYGYYAAITDNAAARVVNMRDFSWPDGQPTPRGLSLETFQFLPFHTRRWRYGYQLGELAAEQAAWNLIDSQTQIIAAQAMTARTVRVANVLTTSSNWPSTHTSTATSLGGGKIDAGSSTTPYLHKNLNAAAVQIAKDTRATIQNENLIAVCNPSDAAAISVSQEVQAYLASSYWARKVIEDGLGSNARYGIPDTFYGYKFVVDDTVYVSTLEQTDSAAYNQPGTFVWPSETLTILSRPGGIEGVFGSVSFSTFTLFAYEEFTQERFEKREDRVINCYITENTAEVLTAGVSGFNITASTSA